MPGYALSQLDRSSRFYVAGHRGLVGGALWRKLKREHFSNLVGRSSAELDLRNREGVFKFFAEQGPRYVVVAAAKVGGILANSSYPVDFLSDNLQIQLNVIDAALKYGVERLLFLGSSCIYPKLAPQPLKEEYLLTGPLEPTNDAYAIAKIAGILHVQAIRRQYDRPWISAMPTNLYGPGDNFSREGSHVLPAMIRRYEDARLSGTSSVTNWGSGLPRREFIHVDDLADACLFLLENYDGNEHINVGVGEDVSIKDLAGIVARSVGFKGDTFWDASKPDGTPRKLMDVNRLKELGWQATIPLDEGIVSTVEWFRNQQVVLEK